MSRFHQIDSSSDGMCGSVTLKDPETGETETVRWSVTGEFTSSSRARDEADRRLAKRLSMVEEG